MQLVSGKGTAVVTRRGIESQRTRKIFNNDKMIAQIINTSAETNKNVVLAAIQT